MTSPFTPNVSAIYISCDCFYCRVNIVNLVGKCLRKHGIGGSQAERGQEIHYVCEWEQLYHG